MAKSSIQAGTNSVTQNVYIRSTITGVGLTGLVYNTSGLIAYYVLPRASSVAITLATQTVTGAWSSGGFVEIDSVNMPGWYRLDLPNAALTSGTFVDVMLRGAANMVDCPIEIDLTVTSTQSSTGGLTNVTSNVTQWNSTNVSVPATAGIPDINVKNIKNSVTAGAAGYVGVDWGNINAPTTTVGLSGTTIGAVTAATLTGDLTATMKTSVITAATAATPTAAAVTGNVGGNVAGSVGSVTGLTVSNLDTTVSSRMATYVQPTGFLAATFPSGTVANTTNITAGTMTNVTNVTGSVGSVTARVTANSDQISGSTIAATLLSAGASSITSGTAITGTLSSTQMSCSGNAASSIDNLWNGRSIIWSSGVLAGAQTTITAYNGTTKVITYLPTSTGAAPSNGDTFDIF